MAVPRLLDKFLIRSASVSPTFAFQSFKNCWFFVLPNIVVTLGSLDPLKS